MSKRITSDDYHRIGHFTQGRVVRHKETYELGHVVGFDRVFYDFGHETILKVLWDDGVVRSIHPSNVYLP
jgi:hypothetical protein